MNYFTPKEMISLLVLLASAVAAECPAGYEVVGSTCIHRSSNGYLKYDDAVAYCHQNFGRLPVLHDCASFTDVATYVDDGESSAATNGYWLGANSLSASRVWQWSDGSAVQMGAPYWAANTVSVEREPSGLSPSNVEENCALISPHRGWSVHDYPCEEAGVYPVCSRIPIRGLCAHPFVLVGTQCVHVIQAEHHWGAARTQCGLIGGDLIILDDCDQYRKVNLYLTKQGKQTGFVWMYRFSNTMCNSTRRVICETRPL
ncbi:C-type mannose receptor 2-like [Hyalella azteca]|uniref:C-type mannose receptor 2-like n=1 Tax=Hyalella azteca TaxID=294128 RepID=A0A8B7NEN4_HYAAZ|nr:C-type mannose receptor 2-like [Hyalella azteca]